MQIFSLLWEGTLGGLLSLKQIAIVVIPILVLLQFARESRLLDKISGFFSPVARLFNISEKGTLPLLVGIVFGLVCGSGVIINAGKSGELEENDMKIIGVFLSLCHAVVEDTMLFVAIGASGLVMLGTRLALAVLVTALFGHVIINKLILGGKEYDKNDRHLSL